MVGERLRDLQDDAGAGGIGRGAVRRGRVASDEVFTAAGERIAATDLPASIRQVVNLAATPGRPVGGMSLSLDEVLERVEGDAAVAAG